MPVVQLKGLNSLTKTLADGRRVTYWYAWKGGPRLPGRPGSKDFMAAYMAALTDRKMPKASTLAALALRYKASPEFTKNALSTKAEWSRWLDRINDDEIGQLTFRALDDRRVKADLLEWRDQWADRPRSADYAMQVLSRVLSWAVSRGELAYNHAAGAEQLSGGNRSDQIWTPAEVDAYVAEAKSPEVGFIVRLACLTGLRREDLTSLAWGHVGEVAIVKPTNKSRGRKIARIPILAETRALLDEIKTQQVRRHAELCTAAAKKGRQSPPNCLTVLSSTRGKPWSVDGLEHQVIDTKGRAGVKKRLHDARGTFATRLRKAGLTAPQIASVMAWEEARVTQLLATYVDNDAIIQGIAEQIAKNESGT
ncbi:MAG: tyrosine-type recombinase/integrase [Caulobacter sp.]|nr:tyrosine-type recombinase/integrase [Caulobacter sp.]